MAYYHQNTLSISSRNKLAQIFAQLINSNSLIEDFRNILASIPTFDSLKLFRFLDRDQKGFITQKDLQHIIGTTHRKLLTYAFSWIDIRKIGQVSRLQFSNFLLPRDNLQLRQISLKNLQQQQMPISQFDTLSIQFGQFQRLITQLMSKEMKLIQRRHSLINLNDYTLQGCRLAIVNSDRKWICSEDIHKFLINFGFQIGSRQAETLIQAVSNKGEGKITFEQLKWIIQGLQTKDKSYRQKLKIANKKKPSKKPVIQIEKFNKFSKSLNKSSHKKQRQFISLINRKKEIQTIQKQNQQKLAQFQKNKLETAHKIYQQQMITLQLQRQQQYLRVIKQREQRQVQHKLKLQLQNLMTKTSKLQQESQRLIRIQNRMNILEDSNQINRQIYCKYQRSNQRKSQSLKKPYKYESQSIPSIQINDYKLSFQNHIRASQAYLQYSKQAHRLIMQDRKQKNVTRNKQNQLFNQTKTSGVLINKHKLLPSMDSRFQSIIQLPLKKRQIKYQKKVQVKDKPII